MNIPINKDFEHDYRETVFKGFTMHEAKYVFAGLVIIVSVCVFLWFFVGLSPVLAVYISVPAGAPVIIAGFWQSPNGLTLKAQMKAVKYRKATELLCYRAGEYQQPVIDRQEAGEELEHKNFKKQKKLHRKYVRTYLRQQKKEKKGESK